ncbi:hypothetical protein [Streptomyces sp. NPDC056144]|uniref:hypothetical protein n=1 Tax=unclassified Streptomyces TaxID=2593676 RepID=UPI0035DE81AA
MHCALAGAGSPTGIRLAAELLTRGHRLTLLTPSPPEQARIALARRMVRLGLYPEYVDELASRLDATGIHPGSPGGRYDAVWCVEPRGPHTVASLLAEAGGPRHTVFHLVTVGEPGAAGALVESAALRDGFPAAVHRLAVPVSDLADHPQMPRPLFTRIAVDLAAALPAPTADGRPLPGGLRLPGPVNLLPLGPAARALADTGEETGRPGPRRYTVEHAVPVPPETLGEALLRSLPHLRLNPTGPADGPWAPAQQTLDRLTGEAGPTEATGKAPAAIPQRTIELTLPAHNTAYLTRAARAAAPTPYELPA